MFPSLILTEHELIVEKKWTDLVTICYLPKHDNRTVIENFYMESSSVGAKIRVVITQVIAFEL